MSWTAILPLKQGGDRKSRLAPRLSIAARAELSDAMAAHVIACLRSAPSISRIVILSPEPPGDPALAWCEDQGRGLNVELAASRSDLGGVPVLVIHGDLPFLCADDIEAMTHVKRVAIAPDRHGAGTNALALPGSCGGFVFAFGRGSLERHGKQAGDFVRVDRRGLAFDVDTPDDLERAIAAGLKAPA
ncbi:2-phospho-L-lactate guanylyltransferase [Novosphingobium pentaromativorans]|uniref:2-phospho-L-lactate guanylyltransferase n=1 Tax=Novosphingobium pentaromativorans US6-1 TaxID=1088721 RepID=G6E806_9SPHN|nr:2-phospho-L-lactate guanylyltransferase [Novosphingobium pentaromativorans]EHJ62649.1 hypothetical protein NSU_0477 [Novosphingobium pentaromativorans US6-1]